MEEVLKETKKYEFIYWVKPSIPEENLGSFASELKSLIEKSEGRIIKEQDFKKERLAYPIKHFTEGFLKINLVELLPEKIDEFKRDLMINNDILRYTINGAEDIEKPIKKFEPKLITKSKVREQETPTPVEDLPAPAVEEKKSDESPVVGRENKNIELEDVDEKLKRILGSDF